LLKDDLSAQHNVFKMYWPLANAERFGAKAPVTA
jgi:hypothetical protein